MQVEKRDGRIVAFDVKKIERAIEQSFGCTNEEPVSIPVLAHAVSTRLPKCDCIGVEAVQDAVERVLMDRGYPATAKHYILYREEHARLRQAQPDAQALADYIHAAKYARSDGDTRETWSETVHRVCDMHCRRFPQYEADISELFEDVQNYNVLPSMRSMQFGGPAIEANNMRMYNCIFTHLDRTHAFSEIFHNLLSGAGQGFSVQWRHVGKLPEIKKIGKTVQHWKILDTIEGWADAVTVLIGAYTYTGAFVEYRYSEIRREGAELKTSGGVAPGHLPLRHLLETLRAFLDERSGRQLRPIEVFDMVCYIAEAVLAGGIRRSSLIAIFDLTDTEMLHAKAHGNFVPFLKNNQRQMANISAVCVRGEVERRDFERLMRLCEEWGDPGFYWTNHPDFGPNPCGEIGLDPRLKVADAPQGKGALLSGHQGCNLTEINGATCEDGQELARRAYVAAAIGTLQAAYTDFPYLGGRRGVTEAIFRRDALIGVGITGMYDNPEVCLDEAALQDASGHVLVANEFWAERLGINPSPRCCTIKPGGTAPLVLGGVASGMTPQHSKRFFRRVTANPNEPVAQAFREANPHMVDTKPNGDWSITFCCEAPEGSITVDELDCIQHLTDIVMVYKAWVLGGHRGGDLTHNVSNTVVVPEDRWDEVIGWIWSSQDSLCAMAFLPQTADKAWPFPPREAVLPEDEARWRKLVEGYTPVDFGNSGGVNAFGPECTGMKCEV